jgi:hypothetical protein
MGGSGCPRALRPGTSSRAVLREDLSKKASGITLPLIFVKEDDE